MTPAQGAILRVLLVAFVAACALFGVATVNSFASAWNSVSIQPTKIHFDASEGIPRALMSVDAKVGGLEHAAHGLSVRGGRCELFAGNGGVHRILVARAINVEHSGSAARMVAELDHGSVKQAMQILKEGPAKDLLCSFDMEVDVFKTGFKFRRTFRAPDFLKGTEDFGFNYRIVRDPMKWQAPTSHQELHVKAHARHWMELNMFSHSPEKLAHFFETTPVHVKAGVTYADVERGAVQLNGHVDSPLKYNIIGTGKDTKVALAIPVDFHGTGDLGKLAIAAKAVTMGGKNQAKVAKNGAMSYSSTFRAHEPRSPLAVALGEKHDLKLRTDGPIDVKKMGKALSLLKGSLFKTLKAMHEKGRDAYARRLSGTPHNPKVHTQQKSIKDGAFKFRAVISISDNDVSTLMAEIKEGEVINLKVNFITRQYHMDERESKMRESWGYKKEWNSDQEMVYFNITAGLDIYTAKAAVDAYVTLGNKLARQEKMMHTIDYASTNRTDARSEYRFENEGLGTAISLHWDQPAASLTASWVLDQNQKETKYMCPKKGLCDFSSYEWFKKDLKEKVADPIPADGLRRLSDDMAPTRHEDKSNSSLQMKASIDFDGDPRVADSKLKMGMEIDLNIPLKLKIDYHLKELSTDMFKHEFSMAGTLPMRRIRQLKYSKASVGPCERPPSQDGSGWCVSGGKEYLIVSGMHMSGSINTDISGQQIVAAGIVSGAKLTCNAQSNPVSEWGSGSIYDAADYDKLMDKDAAMCPMHTSRSSTPDTAPGFKWTKSDDTSCCTEDPKAFLEFSDEMGKDFVHSLPMSFDKGMSEEINAKISNFIKDGMSFDAGNMKMNASAGNDAVSRWKPIVETKEADGKYYMNFALLDGQKEMLKIAGTMKENALSGGDFIGQVHTEGTPALKMALALGDANNKHDMNFSMYSYVKEKYAWEHLITMNTSMDRDPAAVGKHGVKTSMMLHTGDPKSEIVQGGFSIVDSSTATMDKFKMTMSSRMDGETTGFEGDMQRVMTVDDDAYSMTLGSSTMADFPLITGSAKKQLKGTKYELMLGAVAEGGKGNQLFKYAGKAEKKMSGSDTEYAAMWNLMSDSSNELISHTASFVKQSTKGIMNTVVKLEGTKEVLKATSDMAKANNRFKGPIVLSSPSGDIEFPKDLTLQAEASDGFLPIPDKFGMTDFRQFDVKMDVIIEAVHVQSTFYCEQPPDRYPYALPWTGVGMRANVFETKDSGIKHPLADVNVDMDLPIDTAMTKSEPAPSPGPAPVVAPSPSPPKAITTFAAKVEVEDATKFDDASFRAEMAKETGVDTKDVVVVGKTFNVEVGYTFNGDKPITEATAKKAIANANSVAESQVSVQITTRRLNGAAKRMLASTTKVTAVISTTDASQANAVKTAAKDTAEVTKKLKEVGGITATSTLSRAPATSVKITTKIISKNTVAVQVPDATKMTSIAKAAGGTGTATVDDVKTGMEIGIEAHAAFAMGLSLTPFPALLLIIATVLGLQL